MSDSGTCRLKLRLPNGAEMEAEGGAEFVAGERREFAAMLSPRTDGSGPASADAAGGPLEPPWEDITETRAGNIQLRAKLGGDKTERDACIVLIAASRSLLRTPKPTAAQIARWLRMSGYPISRVDRTISAAISKGEILASGSRRARRYELSGPGLAKAFNLAHQLHRLIG